MSINKTVQKYLSMDETDVMAQLNKLDDDIRDVIDLQSLPQATRGKLASLLSKQNLLRKYAKWCRTTGAQAYIKVTYVRGALKVCYTYHKDTVYLPLPPSTRFDVDCVCNVCRTPLPPLKTCLELKCDRYICAECARRDEYNWRCDLHADRGYRTPHYQTPHYQKCTFGLELETERPLTPTTMQAVKSSRLIAGWEPDCSLPDGALEYQTQPFGVHDIDEVVDLVKRLPAARQGKAGGHLHVARTSRQTCSRWYHALSGLSDELAEALNMRHTSDDRWCYLDHGYYTGKHTAVNGDHAGTIELRTFGHWGRDTVSKLPAALRWAHVMWRYFENAPLRRLTAESIRKYAVTSAVYLVGHPSLDERLVVYKERKAAEKAKREAEMWTRVYDNVRKSQLARASHGSHRDGRVWCQRQADKSWLRHAIQRRLEDEDMCYVLSHDKHAAAKIARFYVKHERPALVFDVVTDTSADVDMSTPWRIAQNILASRRARAAHGIRPTYTAKQFVRIMRRQGTLVAIGRDFRFGVSSVAV